MSERDERIQKEAENYRVMGELLKKARAPREAEAVRAVLESDETLENKIRKIRALDQNCPSPETQEARPSVAAVKPGAAAAPDHKLPSAADIIKSKQISMPETVESNLKAIRPTLKRSGFFQFLFGEYGKMKLFGLHTGLIFFRLFPPSFRLNGSTAKTVISAAFREASEFLPTLAFVLERGWMTMEKFDYNLVALFQKYCTVLLGLRGGGIGGEGFLRSLATVENFWLACRYQPDYPVRIAAGIESVLHRFQDRDKSIEAAKGAVLRLLEADSRKASFGTLVLASDMIAARRYIELKDIIRQHPGGVISDFRFDAPPHVALKISAWVSDNIAQIERLAFEKAQIEQIQKFVDQFSGTPENGGIDYDFRFLNTFILTSDDGRKYQYMKDHDDVIQFAFYFYPFFLQSFQNYLSDRVELEGVGSVRGFPGQYFQAEIDRLKAGVVKLLQNNFQCPHMERLEFREFRLKDHRHTPSAGQVGIIQILDELSAVLVNIGMHAASICAHHDRLDTPFMEAWASPAQSVEQQQKDIDKVFWDKKIVSPGYLQDKSFGQSLYTLATLCFLGGLYYHNHELSFIMDRRFQVERSIEDSLRSLGRVADAVTLEEVKRKNGLN